MIEQKVEEITDTEEKQKNLSQEVNNQEKQEKEFKKEELKKEEKDLKELQEELKKWKELALRYAAEVENLKKTFKREKEQYYKFALEAVFKELLPSIDNLERSLEAFSQSKNMDALKEGVELSLKILVQTLGKFGLTQFVPKIGEKFEPYLHEALSTEEHPEIPNGRITKVYQKGYKLHDRLLRPALVSVSTKKETQESSNEPNKAGNKESSNQENKN